MKYGHQLAGILLGTTVLLAGCGTGSGSTGNSVVVAPATATALPTFTPTPTILHPCPPAVKTDRVLPNTVYGVTLPANSIVEKGYVGPDDISISSYTADICSPDTTATMILNTFKAQFSTWMLSSVYPYDERAVPNVITLFACRNVCWIKEDADVRKYVTIESIVERNGLVTYTIHTADVSKR